MFEHILCPVDGSQTSLAALDVAARLAAEQHSQLTICNVTDPARAAALAFGDPGMSAACFDALEGEGKAFLDSAAGRVAETIAATTAELDGAPISSIAEYAKAHGCDLIVMGSHGRSGIGRAVLGSVAEGVMRHARMPVMIVRTQRAGRKADAAPESAGLVRENEPVHHGG